MGGIRLRMELDRVPLWRGDDVSIKQLMDDFATYLYLPRLRAPDVLLAAIRDGLSLLTWKTETFAYAQGKDEATGRYLGLAAGQLVSIQTESDSLLVKPEVASRQIEEDERKTRAADQEPGAKPPEVAEGFAEEGAKPLGKDRTTPAPPVYRRFYGSVNLDPLRVSRDASQIADEVIQHLTKLIGADVKITLEIQARFEQGVSDKTVRDVTENCRTLRFDTYGFEEE